MRGLVKAVCGALVACAFGFSVQAQTTAPLPVTPKKLLLAQQVIDASDARRNTDEVMHAMFQSMSTSMSASLGGADDKAFLAGLMQDEFSKLSAKVLASSAEIYAQTFTEKELADLLAFYQSPSGRIFVSKTPVLLQRTAAVTSPLIPPMQHDILDRVFAYVCSKQKCTADQLKRIEEAKAKALPPTPALSQPVASTPK